MEKLIVASFDGLNNALMAWNKFIQLENKNDIFIYKAIVIDNTSDENSMAILESDTNRTELNNLKGTSIGDLVGMYGGPVGLTIGIAIGSILNSATDFDKYAIDTTFIKKVKEDVSNGTNNLIAHIEIDESVEQTLNELFDSFNAILIKTNTNEALDEHLMKSLDDENMQSLRSRWKYYEIHQKVKAAQLDYRIANAKDREREKLNRVKNRISRTLEKTKSKLDTIK